jgi:hypothetical protein
VLGRFDVHPGKIVCPFQMSTGEVMSLDTILGETKNLEDSLSGIRYVALDASQQAELI